MVLIDAIYRAARDVIGGAFGGLMAVWIASDLNQIAISLIALIIVIFYGLVLVVFDWMREQEKMHLTTGTEGDAATESTFEDREPHWPPHRAS